MKQQIEEIEMTPVDLLANDINQHCPDLAENYCGDTHCVSCLAHALFNEGWRKQSEWISVEDRMPDAIGKIVLVYSQISGVYMTCYTVYTTRFADESVTHWMPLPEPPKGEDDEKQKMSKPKPLLGLQEW